MKNKTIRINKYFAFDIDNKNNRNNFIYNPPLLAESQNIRIELRKEKNHHRPHIHIIKKGRNKFYDVSLALDNLDILAGAEKLRFFEINEYEQIIDFILRNQKILEKIYLKLRGEL